MIYLTLLVALALLAAEGRLLATGAGLADNLGIHYTGSMVPQTQRAADVVGMELPEPATPD